MSSKGQGQASLKSIGKKFKPPPTPTLEGQAIPRGQRPLPSVARDAHGGLPLRSPWTYTRWLYVFFFCVFADFTYSTGLDPLKTLVWLLAMMLLTSRRQFTKFLWREGKSLPFGGFLEQLPASGRLLSRTLLSFLSCM